MLARDLGRTVPELCETMTVAEFSQHLSDYLIEPWGERRADLRSALICQTVANHAGKVRKEPAKLSDFLLDFTPAEKTISAEPDPEEHFKEVQMRFK